VYKLNIDNTKMHGTNVKKEKVSLKVFIARSELPSYLPGETLNLAKVDILPLEVKRSGGYS